MPRLSGIFEQFPDLDKISALNLAPWIKEKFDNNTLANILGNRILYSQTIPVSKQEMEIDLAILREGLKQKPAFVLQAQNRLIIPEALLQRFPPLQRLSGAIIEALNPKGVVQIYTKVKNQVKLVGTLINPVDYEKLNAKDSKVKIAVEGVDGTLALNTISISKSISPLIKIRIGTVDYSVSGGELGVIIDLRVKTNEQ